MLVAVHSLPNASLPSGRGNEPYIKIKYSYLRLKLCVILIFYVGGTIYRVSETKVSQTKQVYNSAILYTL